MSSPSLSTPLRELDSLIHSTMNQLDTNVICAFNSPEGIRLIDTTMLYYIIGEEVLFFQLP